MDLALAGFLINPVALDPTAVPAASESHVGADFGKSLQSAHAQLC